MTAIGPQLVLASTSRYRAALLSRLFDTFDQVAPDVDEAPVEGEGAPATASRLAEAKARAVSLRHPEAIVIGSDQVADLEGRALGKPGTIVAAREQLAACSGRVVVFRTAVCVIDGRNAGMFTAVDTTRVVFRAIDRAEIDRYLVRDEPLDCAGSFRVEAAGVALFERIETTDPTALVGLPMISVCRLLRQAGVSAP